MKQIIDLTLSTKNAQSLFKRFKRPIIWHLYPFKDGLNPKINELVNAELIHLLEKEKALNASIANNHLEESYKEFNKTNVKESVTFKVAIKCPEQMRSIMMLELFDECQMHATFLWINSILTTDEYKRLNKKNYNRFVNFVAHLIAYSKKSS